MMWDRRQVLAGLVAGSAPGSAFGWAVEPAQWEVRAKGASVLLFGDNPYLRTPWRSDRIEAAVKASRVFWRETTPVPDPHGVATFIAKGVDPSRPLSSWLTASELARVTAAAATVGLGDTLGRYRPWLAAVVLEQRFAATAGFDYANSPQSVLTAIAEASGKSIRSEFPDTATVVDTFASFSPAAEVGSLMRAVEDIESGPAVAEREGRAWADGDLRPLIAAVLRMSGAYPDYYQRILVDRNRRWATRIYEMLAGGGTSFVLVGSYHLVGPDSVQNQLPRAGLAARRI